MTTGRVTTKRVEGSTNGRGEGRTDEIIERRGEWGDEAREEVRPEKRFGAWEESLLPSQRWTENTIADRRVDSRYQASRQHAAGSRKQMPDSRQQASRGAWKEESLGYDLRDEEGILTLSALYHYITNPLPTLY
jgi:hypothetical protein